MEFNGINLLLLVPVKIIFKRDERKYEK